MSLLRSRKKSTFFLLLGALSLAACGGGGGGGGGNQPASEWLIATSYVADGGPGIDGIPAIENPNFESAATISSVGDTDLVIALRSGGQVKAYPHDIMDYHEIVNDGPSGDPFTMSYCPLTGSAVAWKGKAAHADASFGVSGLLFSSNLLLYDRETRTLWSQMFQLAVNGPRIREVPETIQVVETDFATLKAMYPNALVMTRATGHDRAYGNYPYGNYKESEGFLFDLAGEDSRLHPKQRVLGIHDGDDAKTYQMESFGASTQTINDQFKDQPIAVVGNSAQNFAAIFSRELADGTILSMSPLQDDLPNVMTDTEGNVWDVFGTAVSGPRAGAQLEPTKSYVAMWLGWASHFRNIEIYFN